MRMSKMYLPTLREVPSEAEIPSHQLLLRAGMMRKLVSGVYSYLPLGYRVIRKIEQIVREEMDRAGSQELLMSAIQPKELWESSGRWDNFGPEMFKLRDRNSREFCLGPTHEEYFTNLIKDEVRSYKQLPLNLYQIQTKYRDEKRPRFGLIRSREFIMKDAYTYDMDEEGLKKSYENMWKAYDRVFTRLKLNYKVVQGDTGAMGGKVSHEFMAMSEVGEGEIAYCDSCEYAATDENAIVVYKIKEKNEEEITRNIIKNYFEDGYVFHTFNIGIYENVLSKGLSLTPDIFPNDKIIAIKEIFKSKNKGVFGLYNPTDNKVFFASSPIYIYQYGAGSPSFFRKLIFMNDKKDSYINRDYERCLISIKNTIKEYNLSNVEGELVLSLFNELYSLFSRNDYIIALKKKKKNIKIEDYSQNNLRNIIKQDMSVDYRFYENINSNDLEFILVRNHSNTIKRSRT